MNAAGPCVIWFTGLSGSGKTTLARAVARQLASEGVGVCVLDGDDLRRGLSADLDFSHAGRAENMRRAREIALLLTAQGITAIVALVSPLQAERERARQAVVAAGVPFIEVYLDCPLEVCERRDAKGLYRRARAGELPGLTGLADAYAAPAQPELTLPTGAEAPAASLARVLAYLRGA